MSSTRLRPLPIVFVLCALCAVVACANVGKASPVGPAEPVRIAYDVPAACPDESFFFDQMRARTSRVRRATKGEAARRLTVSVKADTGIMRGRLEVRSANGETTVRDVSGRRCDQVISALAFVAALGVDPDASFAPSAGPDQPSVDAPNEPTRGVPVPPGETASSEDSIAPPRDDTPASVPLIANGPASAGDRPVQPHEVAFRPPGGGLSFLVGADAWSIIGLLSAPAWGGRAWLEAQTHAHTGLVSPSGRVSIGGLATAPHSLGPGRARFQLVTVRLDGCPLRWPVRSSLQIEPCAFFEAGALFGQGLRSAAPRAGVTQHVTAGPLSRLRLALNGRVHLGLEAALVFPLVRTTLRFGESVGYEPPVVGVAFGAGVGMNFP